MDFWSKNNRSILWQERNDYYKECIDELVDDRDSMKSYYQKMIDNNNESVIDFEEDLIRDYKLYVQELIKVIKLRTNLCCGSYQLKPYTSCITPQCGEYNTHSLLLNKFVEINNSYIYKEDDN
jgi:hypothetical protein